MTASIAFVDLPKETCTLCGHGMHPGTSVAVLQGPSGEGWVCHECLWSLAHADDPIEWLLTRARSIESRWLELQGVAERMRRLAECGIELPSRAELEATGYGEIPF